MSRRRVIAIGSLLAVLAVLLLGLLLPNRDPVAIEFMWWQLWQLPLWGTMAICMLGGALLTFSGMGFLWAVERRQRRLANRHARDVETEVTELRRLLARDTAGLPQRSEDGRADQS